MERASIGVIGGLIGEGIGVEAWLERFGVWLRSVAQRIPFFTSEGEGEHQMVEGFVVASLLYCVGTMTIVGSIQDGLGKPDLLVLSGVAEAEETPTKWQPLNSLGGRLTNVAASRACTSALGLTGGAMPYDISVSTPPKWRQSARIGGLAAKLVK